MLLQKIRPYAKAAVAIAGFVLVAGEQIVSGHVDPHALLVAGTAALTALGVYRVSNKA